MYGFYLQPVGVFPVVAGGGSSCIAVFISQLIVAAYRFISFIYICFAVGPTQEVPAMYIIHVTVMVVVFIIVGLFVGVYPQYALQILLQGVNTAVDNSYE